MFYVFNLGAAIRYPVVQHNGHYMFGTNACLRYLLSQHSEYVASSHSVALDDFLYYESVTIQPLLSSSSAGNDCFSSACVKRERKMMIELS